MTAYPQEWLDRMMSMLGGEYPAFLAALEQNSAAGLRVNPLREGDAAEALAKYAFNPVPWYPEFGRYVRDGAPGEFPLRPGADIAHFSGAYYMQEPSAMAAVAALSPRSGELVLDLCAAPGGKSGQIAAALGDEGALVANEPEPSRARMLAGNLERLGVSNAAVVSAQPARLAEKWPETFDAVLCDAPCSGEGMFRRDPDSRAQWGPRSEEGCAARQRAILDAAARMVRPGGRLAYSTCTFNARENEDNIAWLLKEHPEFSPGQFALSGVGESVNGCLRLWPHKLRGEGHFVALLRKAGAAREEPVKELVKERGKRISRGNPNSRRAAAPNPLQAETALRALESEAISALPNGLSSMRREMLGDRLLLVPGRMPDTDGVYCLRRGLPACRVGASHIEPEHSLAMALPRFAARAEFALSLEQARGWLRGEPIRADLPGARWVWVQYAGLPLGWGKHSEGTIKNHLPKGLWQRRGEGE